ncbi:helix-turn-helix domain-containing protein [Micromonospora sp. M12]
MRPAALDWSVDNCTIARAMEVLGERWTLVVLREVFTGVRRFDDMRVRTGIPRQVLTNRLATLVEQGVLSREPYREPGSRLRHEYRLTEKGLDLWPVLVAVLGWVTGTSPTPRAHRSPPLTVTVAPRCAPSCAAPTVTTWVRCVTCCPARARCPPPHSLTRERRTPWYARAVPRTRGTRSSGALMSVRVHRQFGRRSGVTVVVRQRVSGVAAIRLIKICESGRIQALSMILSM